MNIDRTYTLRSGLARGLKRKGGIGLRNMIGRRSRPSPEEDFLTSLDLTGRTVFDVGAFEGIHAIFFAHRVGAGGNVITFEPDPDNYRRVVENVHANSFGNVVVKNLGVAAEPGSLTFVYPRDRGRGTADAAGLAHYSSDAGARVATLPVTSIDAETRSGRCAPPDFVKIDVEGLELAVLQGMEWTASRHKPAIFVEMHGWGQEAKRQNARRVLDWLSRHGYAVRHVESGRALAADDADTAREGHLYCTA
jgi:FkbM family methyltransferase